MICHGNHWHFGAAPHAWHVDLPLVPDQVVLVRGEGAAEMRTAQLRSGAHLFVLRHPGPLGREVAGSVTAGHLCSGEGKIFFAYALKYVPQLRVQGGLQWDHFPYLGGLRGSLPQLPLRSGELLRYGYR